MADPELASKLAKRLESVDDTVTDSSKAETPPPPVPKMPEKVVPNPYVAVDNTVSIDDLIAKAMERKEHPEENNNVASPNGITMDDAHVVTATVNGHDTQPDIHTGPPPKRTLAELLAKDQERSVSPPRVSSPDTSAKQTPPPKTTIGELLVKDKQPLSPPPTSKCPLVPVQHHVSKPSTRRLSPEDDGSELERKLAAQRAKKSSASVAATESNVIFSTPENSIPPQKPPRSEEPVKTAPVEDHGKSSQLEETEKPPCSSSPQGSTPLPQDSPPSEGIEKTEERNQSSQPKETEKPPCSDEPGKLPQSEEPAVPLEQTAQNGVPEETDMEHRKDNATAKSFSPSRELLEMIQHENGIRSPPPIPPPKPQTPSHSRPQSPVVKVNCLFLI
ncbi:unnamed protein product [Haemonchus placei]|uniref:WH2 domain-containing protein n=1 Tax=Haemonchus placei TaxID=6290 RepID=A0A0N4WJ71_HAEPC|nr:unnamed protein product [Haemonchus placei]